MAKGDANPVAVDVRERIGAALRQRRIELGLTGEAAGRIIGVTGAQWRKFELGVDRIAAEQLAVVCREMRISSDALLGLGANVEPPPEAAELDREVRDVVAKLRSMSPRTRREATRMFRDLAAAERPIA